MLVLRSNEGRGNRGIVSTFWRVDNCKHGTRLFASVEGNSMTIRANLKQSLIIRCTTKNPALFPNRTALIFTTSCTQSSHTSSATHSTPIPCISPAPFFRRKIARELHRPRIKSQCRCIGLSITDPQHSSTPYTTDQTRPGSGERRKLRASQVGGFAFGVTGGG